VFFDFHAEVIGTDVFSTWGYLFCMVGFFIPVVNAVIVVIRVCFWYISLLTSLKVC
jgi:hypothetical protein